MNGESKVHPLLGDLLFLFVHWLNLLMLKTLRKKEIVVSIYHCRFTATSKLVSRKLSSEIYDPNPEIRFT